MRGILILFLLTLLLDCVGNKTKSVTENLIIANEYYDKDDYEAAKTVFLEIVKMDTVLPEVFYKLGFCYAKQFDFENSTNYYLKSIDYGFRKGDAYFNIGLNMTCIEEDSIAIDYFNKALEFFPNDLEIIEEKRQCEKRIGLLSI